MKISLRHLEIFTVVAKRGSIKEAANELYLSPSAVSMSLSELEKSLGVKLFDRLGKKLILNNFGELLFQEANHLIDRVNYIENIFKSKKFSGNFKIGCTQSIGNYVLPDIISLFKNENPDVEISLIIENTENIMKKLLKFEIDLAFIEGIVNHKLVESYNWLKDEIVIFCGKNHIFSKKKRVTINDLKKAQWILREKGSGTRDIFEKAIYNKIKNLKIFLEINQIEGIKRIVEKGIGVGALSYFTIKKELENGSLVKLNTSFKIEREFKIVLHKKKFKTPLIEEFIKFSKERFA